MSEGNCESECNLGDLREGINAGKRKDQGESEWTKNRKGEKNGGKQKVQIMCEQTPGQYTCW